VKILLAWRILTHEKGRSGLAIGGILVAILLMFLQLGIYASVPRGGLLFYDAMRFDLMLASSAYVFEAQPSAFPRRRISQALALPEVAQATALYHNSGHWLNDRAGLVRDVFVIAFKPEDAVFNLPEIDRQREVLRRPDTILIDADSRPEFGVLVPGRRIEIDGRSVEIGGVYHLGTGFVGLGVAITSDINFLRIFPDQNLTDTNLGLVTLKPGADPDRVAQQLRRIMLADTQVFTRKELAASEMNYWLTSTSTGLIFGFGVMIAIVVGTVILSQTLSAQISRQLPQYAALKAIGYTHGYLSGVVVMLAIIMTSVSYVPALILSLAIYWIVRTATLLPIAMTSTRMVGVLATVWLMSALSAIFALRLLRRADPVELF
jgi:putative ABC transport system permease protein